MELQQEELEKERKRVNDCLNQKNRGKTAMLKEKQLKQRQKEVEEEIKQIERKKKVFQEESVLAHELAKKQQSSAPKQAEVVVPTAAKLFNRN